jgi:hypothetical protein
MGKRGPQPQSAELKRLRGNPGKRAIKEVPTAEAGVPPCPIELEHIAVEWNHYGNILAKLGILRETDWPMFDAMWRTWDKYKTIAERRVVLDELVEKAGDDPETDASVMKSLFTLITKIEPLELQYLAALVRLLDHFGMAPSSRGSISVEAPKGESEFEQFLNRGKVVAK